MPYVRGFLKLGRRHRPGRPDIGLPDPEHPVDPDYGIEEGGNIDNELPEVDPPDPPPGLWPPLTPEHPWRPIDPGWGQGRPQPPTVGGGPARPPGAPPVVGGGPARPERPVDPGWGIEAPPGTIWPPLPPGVSGHYWALVAIGGMPGGVQYRYVVVDAGLRPGNRPPGSGGNRPDQGLPPEAQPKPGE